MRIWITGASGSLGIELLKEVRRLYPNSEVRSPSRLELDLENSADVNKFVQDFKPTHVFHLAAKVFGISGHQQYPYESLLSITRIDLNVFDSLLKFPPKWIYYSSTVAAYGYPYRNTSLKEEDFLKGSPHSSEYGYAMAKRHGLSYLEVLKNSYGVSFAYGLTTNLFGSGDRFLEGKGHVVISLLKKGIQARENNNRLEVWGSGSASRDFLSTASASKLICSLINMDTGPINIASGQEITIREIAEDICEIFEIKEGFSFTGINEGISNRVCSVEKLSKYSADCKLLSSKAELKNAILAFRNSSLKFNYPH